MKKINTTPGPLCTLQALPCGCGAAVRYGITNPPSPVEAGDRHGSLRSHTTCGSEVYPKTRDIYEFYYVSESAEDAPKAYPSPDQIGYADP